MKNLMDKFKAYGEGTPEGLKKKQYMIIGVIFVAVSGFLWIAMSGAKTVSKLERTVDKPKKIVVGDLIDEKETWFSRLEEKSHSMATQVSQYKKENNLLSKRLENLEAALLAQVKDNKPQKKKKKPQGTVRVPSFNASSMTPALPAPKKVATNTFPLGGAELRDNSSFEPLTKIIHLSVGDTDNFHHAKDYVVAGTSAKAVLTAGVVVSTSVSTQGNPQPIMLRLADQGNQPRGWKSRLKDAVMIGSCYGDLSSERAVCRIHTLSFVERSGRTVERSVEGWIIGEDGAPGLRGKVVDRAGKVVREAFVAGMLSGMSSFFKNSAQSAVYPVSPFGQTNALKTDDVLKSGASQGASNALEKLADFSIKRAEAMNPVLVVHPGRVVDVVFKKGFDLGPSKQKGFHPVQVTRSNTQNFGGTFNGN